LILFEHERLQLVQWDFEANDGVLDLEKFLISILCNFELYQLSGEDKSDKELKDKDVKDEEKDSDDSGNETSGVAVPAPNKADESSRGSNANSSGHAPSRGGSKTDTAAAEGSAGGTGGETLGKEVSDFSADLLYKAASIIELFQEIDVHNNDTITWEALSTYLIEHGKVHSQEGDGRYY